MGRQNTMDEPCANSLRTIRLWLQRFAPALPVVALACQLGEIFCIGTGSATVFFGVIGHTVASGRHISISQSREILFSKVLGALVEVLRRKPIRWFE